MSHLVMYLYGDRNPEISVLLREQSLHFLVDQLFSAEELVLPSALPPIWADAIRLDLLTTDGRRYGAGSRLVLIPAVAEQRVIDLLRPALASYVEIAGEVGAELRALYEQMDLAKTFAWHQVSHSLLAGLFLDLAMGVEVLRSRRIAHKPSGDTVIWAFQSVSSENGFGVGAVMADPPLRVLFGELWHRRTRQGAVQVGSSLTGALARLGRGEQVEDSKAVLYLKHLKLVRTAGRSLQLQIPFFQVSDTERLLTLLAEGARRLVEDAVFPALDRLASDAWWGKRLSQDAYSHAAIRLVMDHGIDRVITAGKCPPFPEAGDASVEWGRWLWEEPEGPRTVMPPLAMRETEGSRA